MARSELARFLDCATVQFVRVFPHPVERVWQAITDPSEVAAWFTTGRIELKLGGAWRIGAEGGGFEGVITAFERLRLVRFEGRIPGGGPGYCQYELEAVGGGTRMTFTQSFADGQTDLGGWHELFDALGDHLDGMAPGAGLPPSWVGAVARRWADGMVQEGAFDRATADGYVQGLRREEEGLELNRIYAERLGAPDKGD
jgi:uncharacterized protein YndB with AHSA1/START domain